MDRYIFICMIISLFFHICLSTHECTRTIVGPRMTFACPANISGQDLAIYDLTVTQLDAITEFVAMGTSNSSRGPFTSIPVNICLLRNLQNINFANNQIQQVDPTESLDDCLKNVEILDVSNNNITQFPSVMIYNMDSLIELYFQRNQLSEVPGNAFEDISSIDILDFSYNQLTAFELWALEVEIKADFRFNQISLITNKYFFTNVRNMTQSETPPDVLLSNNAATINFTDAVYEMYNQCEEVQDWIRSGSRFNYFTVKLGSIDLGTTRMQCNCDQRYFLSLSRDLPGWSMPLGDTLCTNGSTNLNGVVLFNSTCYPNIVYLNSTVDFSQVYPRFCKIQDSELGAVTNATMTPPSYTGTRYPHYETAFLQPGACYFTFSSNTSMSPRCTNDISNTASRLPAEFFSNPYMSNINRVTYTSPLSSLPSYLCSLPSGTIDLSGQAFTTLTDVTFPCLDSFRTVILAQNNITSVSMSNGIFQNLTLLDLSSNRLTQLPYSILKTAPSSLRYVDLRNNSITYIDLFLYTLPFTVNLDGNPINRSNIINLQNVTLGNISNSSIILPPIVGSTTYIIRDIDAKTYGVCGGSFQSLRSYLINFRLVFNTVLLECTCASINLRNLYQRIGLYITTDFNCSVTAETTPFFNLNMSSCSNATNLTSGLCAGVTPETNNQTLPTTTDPLGVNGTTTISSMSNNTNSSTRPPPPTPLPSTTTPGPDSSRTGLIVGVVIGVVAFLAIVGGIIAYFIIKSKKAAAAAGKKTVLRAAAPPGDDDPRRPRIQPRNLRTVKLAPLASAPTRLPAGPVSTVLPSGKASTLSTSTLKAPAKGIPVRSDAIKSPSEINASLPPNSNALSNSSSFRPIDNMTINQGPPPSQPFQAPKPQKPTTTQLLNTGGDLRYS